MIVMLAWLDTKGKPLEELKQGMIMVGFAFLKEVTSLGRGSWPETGREAKKKVFEIVQVRNSGQNYSFVREEAE